MQPTGQVLINVFSLLNEVGVKSLLIGGQACVIYGAKVSTVDIDITILTTTANLEKLKLALTELKAHPSRASVSLDVDLLSRGHSLHYHCEEAGYYGIRLDILGRLPRLDSFKKLWERRFEYISESGVVIPLLSIPDLILSKKTGRLKDAADITALVNSHYAMHCISPSKSDIELWLREAREEDVLMMFVEKYPSSARGLVKARPLLKCALDQNMGALRIGLITEATEEATSHEKFRAPLRTEVRAIARSEKTSRNSHSKKKRHS